MSLALHESSQPPFRGQEIAWCLAKSKRHNGQPDTHRPAAAWPAAGAAQRRRTATSAAARFRLRMTREPWTASKQLAPLCPRRLARQFGEWRRPRGAGNVGKAKQQQRKKGHAAGQMGQRHGAATTLQFAHPPLLSSHPLAERNHPGGSPCRASSTIALPRTWSRSRGLPIPAQHAPFLVC